MDRETLLELIPAYAVDALDADERDAVAAFIERDPEARAILADYEAITAMLPMVAPMRPAPAHLQSDLRSRLAARKQVSSPAPIIEAKPAPKLLPKEEKPSQTSPAKEEKALRATPIAVWLLSAAAVLALVLVGAFILLRPQVPSMSPEMAAAKAEYEAIVAEANHIRYDVTAEENLNVEGELVVSAAGGNAILRIASLPQLTEEQSYQLWLASEGAINSGGVFHWPTGHGPYYVRIRTPLEELVRIGMTIEPRDGSEQPEGERIFGVVVASAR